MSNRRWVRIDCDYYLDEDEIFIDEPLTQREAYQWLIMNAAWKDTSHTIGDTDFIVPRGSQYRTIRKLCNEWKWGNTKVRNYLALLERKHKIKTETNTGKTLITLCNYSKFQDKSEKPTQEQHTDNTQTTQEQHTKGTNNTITPISSSLHSEDILGLPEKIVNSKIEINQAFEAYNIAASENDWAVCQKISKARNSQMKARLKDCGGIDGFMACLEKCKASDFLQGRVGGTNGTFQLGIDFILRDSSFTKIMEGNYDNRKQPEKQKSMSSASMFFEAARQAEGLSQ